VGRFPGPRNPTPDRCHHAPKAGKYYEANGCRPGSRIWLVGSFFALLIDMRFRWDASADPVPIIAAFFFPECCCRDSSGLHDLSSLVAATLFVRIAVSQSGRSTSSSTLRGGVLLFWEVSSGLESRQSRFKTRNRPSVADVGANFNQRRSAEASDRATRRPSACHDFRRVARFPRLRLATTILTVRYADR